MKKKPVSLSELAKLVAAKTGITQADSSMMVRGVIDTIQEEILKGNDIAIRNFGTFKLHLNESKTCRNPKTGETFVVPPRYQCRWKPVPSFKEKIKVIKPVEVSE